MLIDCPPSLSLLTVNALTAAQRVLIPMQCEYYALEGLSDLVATIKRVRAHLNPQLEIAGLLRTMYDPRNTLSQQVSQQLEAHFGDKVYRTLVPRNVRLAEAPSYGVPAVLWDASSKGAQAYLALADEMLAQDEPHDKPKGLGRGLDALLGGDDEPRARSARARCRSRSIRPGQYQPRTRMDQQALAELAASIRAQGLMQPILVRPVDRDALRAHRRRAPLARGADGRPRARSRRSCAKCPTRPALAMALIENIQREDLNPLEEAAGVQRLIDEFEHDARAGGRRGRPLAQRDHQPAAPAEAGEARAGDADAGRARNGPCVDVFMSAAPRPYSMPSRWVGTNGSLRPLLERAGRARRRCGRRRRASSAPAAGRGGSPTGCVTRASAGPLGERLAVEAERREALGEQRLAAAVVGSDRAAGDQLLGEMQVRDTDSERSASGSEAAHARRQRRDVFGPHVDRDLGEARLVVLLFLLRRDARDPAHVVLQAPHQVGRRVGVGEAFVARDDAVR